MFPRTMSQLILILMHTSADNGDILIHLGWRVHVNVKLTVQYMCKEFTLPARTSQISKLLPQLKRCYTLLLCDSIQVFAEILRHLHRLARLLKVVIVR